MSKTIFKAHTQDQPMHKDSILVEVHKDIYHTMMEAIERDSKVAMEVLQIIADQSVIEIAISGKRQSIQMQRTLGSKRQ
jgi:hypothetical protein